MIWPAYFWRLAGYFRQSMSHLTTDQRERLEYVIEARERAEAFPRAYVYYFGAISIALVPLEAYAPVPVVAPFALLCTALAVMMVAATRAFVARRSFALRPWYGDQRFKFCRCRSSLR